MKVETYEVMSIDVDSENRVLDEIRSSEAVQLIEELGLKGQHQFLQKESGAAVVRFPYRRMTLEESRIFKVICPSETDLQDYSDGPIPLRILQVAAFAKDFCKKVVVWHPESAVEKDPILVGKMKGRNGWEWEQEDYLLARWGDELVTLDEARELAMTKLAPMVRQKVSSVHARLAAIAGDIQGTVESYLRGGEVDIPNLSANDLGLRV